MGRLYLEVACGAHLQIKGEEIWSWKYRGGGRNQNLQRIYSPACEEII